ncbi:MAG: crosslink repair DNA glycosylase YcaQ family protein [Enterobacterales bacterium]|nr:crosslink repair DNA glycosylase YcaQ family protein [Enterobacterales bacterium]
MPNSLSQQDTQKLILLSQGIYADRSIGVGESATYQAIKSLGYVQIDSISMVERAHHHSLWNRQAGYSASHIDQLLADKKIFEYWSHAAAYLPMDHYRFSLPRKMAFKRGEKHWFEQDTKSQALVLNRIKTEGPLQAKDFKDTRQTKSGWWDWKPAKKALEQLYMQGDLMVVKRQGFQKVYDLKQRVLPANIDTSMPTEDAYFQHLIMIYLKANAVGTAEQISYLLKGVKSSIQNCCLQMCEQGRLISITIDKQGYLLCPILNRF